jgi:2-polyprenyl-3-methyl-5-hydroxy-6-metoxy-1,4-benzoquinol methylase
MTMATALAITDLVTERRQAFQAKLMESAAGAFNIFTIYLGDQLGLYEALAKERAMTAGELALRTGTNVRYVREWLEQQTVAGILEVANPEDGAGKRRFSLPEGHDEVLAGGESLECMAGVVQTVFGAVKPMERIVNAYQTGQGIPFHAYGQDMREGIARMNRPMYRQLLGQEWIPAMPDIAAKLRRAGAKVADVGCGCGDSSVSLAHCYPEATVHGFDLDADSIAEARKKAGAEGVANRVTFEVMDAAEAEGAGAYDLVMALECIHDMPHPVEALRAMKRLVSADGAVFIADERVGERFTAEGQELEWLMYGFSVLHCLPNSMCGCNPAGTGTVMRVDTLRQYAGDAGFAGLEVLDIGNPFFRFYRLK